MQKNIASQKFVVFAFNRTTNAPLIGDAANITANLQKDFGTSTATNDVNPTELEDGYYSFDLTQAETNADHLVLYPASSTADIQVIGVPAAIFTVSAGSPDEVVQSADNDTILSGLNDFDPANDAVAVVTSLTGHTAQTGDNFAQLDELTEDDGTGNLRYTAKALENVQSFGGGVVHGNYTFSNNTSATNPSSGNAKVDNGTYANITEAYISGTTQNGFPASDWISAIKSGDRITYAEEQNGVNYIRMEATADAVDNGGWFTVEVDFLEAGGQIGNNSTMILYLVKEAVSVGLLADAVWDEVLTGATHNINNSAGRQLRELKSGNILNSGTTQVGSTADIVIIASDADSQDGYYNGQELIIDGEARIILAYVGSTRAATLNRALINGAPASGVDYAVLTLGLSFAVAVGASYAGLSVHIGASGSTTAIINRDGTDTNPIDDGQLTNARTIAAAKNLDSYFMGNGSSISLNEAYENWGFSGAGSTVDCNGQSISNSRFVGVTVTGVSTDLGGGAVVYSNCRILAHTLSGFSGLNNCDLVGAITLNAATTFRFKDCAPIFESGCVFNFSSLGNQNLLLLNWNDGATIQNLGNSGTDKIIITGNGHVTLEASCVGGTIEWSGDIAFTNNGSGITFVQGLVGDVSDKIDAIQGATFSESTDSLEAIRNRGDAAWLTGAGGSSPTVAQIVDGVWDELKSAHTDADTFGDYLDTEVSSVSGGGGLDQQDVRDAMKLAPTAGAPAAGSVDLHLDDILADTSDLQSSQGDWLTATGFATVNPDNASIAAILVDTGTTIPTQIGNLNDFDPANDDVAVVSLVNVTTENTDMVSNPDNVSIAAILVDTNDLQINQGNWLTASGFATSAALATVDSNVDAILVDTGTSIPDLIDALNDLSAGDVLAGGDIDGYSLEEAQKLILASAAGILSGAATTSIQIQAADGSKTRLTATVDVDGNRVAVTKDATG